MLYNNEKISQVSMKDRLKGVENLASYLGTWRKKNPQTFRIDGHDSIGPANPAQWIFFEITSLREEDFSGLEYGKTVNGTMWNGIYYLTASTQGDAIDYFLDRVSSSKSPSDLFLLAYTKGREGLPNKRKLFLKDASDYINSGWFCKQHVSRFPVSPGGN